MSENSQVTQITNVHFMVSFKAKYPIANVNFMVLFKIKYLMTNMVAT